MKTTSGPSGKRIGLAGHAGVAHAHGHSGLVHDDSGGLVIVGSIARELLRVDTHVRRVEVDLADNSILVSTVSGGTGTSFVRRGITPAEAQLMKAAEGQDALFCQALAVRTLGRIYGQGVLEVPAAFEGALGNAVVDSLHRAAPGRFHIVEESVATNDGLIGGMVAEVGGVDTALLLMVNRCSGGIGPVEDLEGNVALGSKRKLMDKLGMLRCPTIVVESKAYFPEVSDRIERHTLLVRFQRGLDNRVVAECLHGAAVELGYPVMLWDSAFPPPQGALKEKRLEFSARLIGLANRLIDAKLGSEKVLLSAELAKLASEDAGAITFMSDGLHDIVRAPGTIPGTSAVLSMLVSREYRDHWKIPLMEPADVEIAQRTIERAIGLLASRWDEAYEELDRYYVSVDRLEESVR